MNDANHAIFEACYRADSYRPKNDYFAALHATRLAMLRELPRGSRVLDVGCGSGAFLLPLLASAYEVTGLDYSQKILDELRREAASRGIAADRLHLLAGDAREMSLPAASFDAVFSFATLYAIPEVERVLAEVARVLRPGGLAFLELGNSRSLNAIEATRVGNGLTSFHQSTGRMRHLLRRCGLATQRVRAFQLYPLWGGGTDRAERLLNPQLADALAVAEGGVMLDERLCASPWLQPFAFRQLWCVQKGGVERELPAVPASLPEEPEVQREQRRLAAAELLRGDVAAARDRLLACIRANPNDPRAPLALAAIYDGDPEQRLVRSWRRALTRTGHWPAEGSAITMCPAVPQQTPKISIVLPTFQSARLLPEAVQSVFAQTFGDFELIVVDDGSTDGTWRYLSRLRDPRVQCLKQANQRLPTALNRGFQLARGELRTWISADNVCEPTMLEKLVAALDDNPRAQLAVAGFARVDHRLQRLGVITGQDVSFAGFLPRNPGVAAFAYRAATARSVGDYQSELEGAEDWDYWLRLVQHGPAVRLDDVLCRYREHRASMTTTIPERVHRASERVVERWWQRHDGLPSLELLGGDGSIWLPLGTRLLESPFVPARMACQALRNALQHDPSDGRALVQSCIALARAGATRAAAQLAIRFANAADPGLRRLADKVRRLAAGDVAVRAEQLPLLPIEEPVLTCAG